MTNDDAARAEVLAIAELSAREDRHGLAVPSIDLPGDRAGARGHVKDCATEGP